MRLPNGYGSVYKLSGNRRNPYRACVTVGWTDERKQIVKTIGYYPNKARAIDALSEYRKNPYDLDATTITFSEVFEKYAEIKFPTISDKNAKDYRASFNLFSELHSTAFKDIKSAMLQKIIDNSGKGYQTLRKIKVMLNQVYSFAMANDIIQKNYASFVSIGKDETESTRAPFSTEEIARLWDNLNRLDWIDTVLIMIYTGLRIGELLDLKTQNIDLEQETIRGGSKTAAGKNRIVPINNKILPLIKSRYCESNENLIWHNGKPVNYYTYRDTYFDRVMQQLEMSHKPHDCRHTFATLMDNAGANKLSIKRIMGHASQDITDKVYTHKDIEELKKAIALI